MPPPPLPAFLGHHTDTHVECEFYDGMDYSLTQSATKNHVGASTDTLADTKHHCCSKCGMQAGCTDFVYEPSSKTCVLMPAVPSYMLKRSPNNSTIAGSVTISRVTQTHAACHFHVGSGYSGGTLGIGKALPGKQMATKQDCCDACERDPRCAKFVFEHYSRDCQLYGPEAEHYFTFNLLSGTVDGRAEPDANEALHGGDNGDSDEGELAWGDGATADPILAALDGDLGQPPMPPLFDFNARPPPSPKGGEDRMARLVLEDASLGVGFLFMFGFSIFGYLFFAQDISNLLFTWTGGKFGRPSRTLLPTSEPTSMDMSTEPGAGKDGWAKVTVQTSQLNQKKDIEVARCETLDELREMIWDEFGHLLKGTRVKETVLLVWAASADDEEDGKGSRWMLVTDSSDMSRVLRCSAMKLRDKKSVDVKALAVAFAPELANKKRSKFKKAGKRESERTKHGKTSRADKQARRDKTLDEEDEEDNEEDSEEDSEEDEEDGSDDEELGMSSRAKAIAARKARRAAADDDSASDNDAEPLCADEKVMPSSSTSASKSASPNPKGKARKAGKAGNRDKKTRARAAPSDDDEPDGGIAPVTTPLLGKRVEVHGLQGKADLNGRTGVAATFDKEKGRYHVRLEGRKAGKSSLLAFKPENLRLAA